MVINGSLALNCEPEPAKQAAAGTPHHIAVGEGLPLGLVLAVNQTNTGGNVKQVLRGAGVGGGL